MYQIEMNRFSKKIDEQNIRMEAKRALHDIIEEFFSVDYHNISEERKRKVENNFEIRRFDCIVFCTKFDIYEVEEILNQIESNLLTILDQSVDRPKIKKKSNEGKISVDSSKTEASFKLEKEYNI